MLYSMIHSLVQLYFVGLICFFLPKGIISSLVLHFGKVYYSFTSISLPYLTQVDDIQYMTSLHFSLGSYVYPSLLATLKTTLDIKPKTEIEIYIYTRHSNREIWWGECDDA